MQIVPDSYGSSLMERNDCHHPAGSAVGGQFCSQTQTPAFQRWFKKSKVVDAQGRPLRVYHGTRVSGHDEFRSSAFQNVAGYFAADPEVASIAATYALSTDNPSIYPVYLSLQNPVDLRGVDGAKDLTVEEFVAALPFVTSPQVIESFRAYLAKNNYRDTMPVWSFLATDHFRGEMRRHGFDGVMYNEYSPETMNQYLDIEPGRRPVKDATAFIAFEATQVKSAIGNRGTWDPKSRKITERGRR